MCGNLRDTKINYNLIKNLINRLVNRSYPDFQEFCQLISEEIVAKIESPLAERELKVFELISSEAQQIFYKDKLVLFPFVEKKIDEGISDEVIFLIQKTLLDSLNLQKRLSRFIQNYSVNFNDKIDEFSPVRKITELWDRICNEKSSVLELLSIDSINGLRND